MTTINTNVQSLNAQRNLSASQSSLSTSMQRLSSGLRINSAKDDAAGLAISERMNAQVKGLNMAARNANDGISLAQTAEGSLGKVSDMLQRMRELAVQSANATNSASDRGAMQAEVSALRSEIGRVADQTSFNGRKMLDGSFNGAAFQVGANANQTISVASVANVNTNALGSVSNASIGVTVTTTNITPVGRDTIAAGVLSVGGVALGAIGAATSGAERIGQLAAAINEKSGASGINAAVVTNTSGVITGLNLTREGAIGVDTIAGATAATVGFDTLASNVATAATDLAGIDTLDISSFAGATLAMKQIDSALNQVNSSRANLGALQSRFESAVSSIGIQSENISAARGRIVDADFAKETSSLSRAQILQQAGTAMVAQANQLPQGVLALLR
jgi:flagellin